MMQATTTLKNTVKTMVSKHPIVSTIVTSLTATTAVAGMVQVHAELQEAGGWLSSSSSSSSLSSLSSIRQLPRDYNREDIQKYWMHRPLSVVYRLGQVGYQLGPVMANFFWDFYIFVPTSTTTSCSRHFQEHEQNLLQFHARQLREALTNLGPAWVKGGQQLAIRPDLVPPIVLKELQQLCDSVRPISDDIAFNVLRQELGVQDMETTFQELQLVASASLGQVYQAKLLRVNNNNHTNTTTSTTTNKNHHKKNDKIKETLTALPLVAIKVQRPGMRKSFSLDLFLLEQYVDLVDLFTSIFTNQKPFHRALFDSFSHGSYSELDYIKEARNQIYFQKALQQRQQKVEVPHVHLEYTTEKVLTTEWIQGRKLADSCQDKIRELIPIGVELFLTQLLDIGMFHVDPHPGNLLVTTATTTGKEQEGMLC